MYKEDVIAVEECMNYLPLKITIIYKDYLPLYTTVSLNVYKNI